MTPADFKALAEFLPADRIITSTPEVERLSRDFYWYSPILKRDLADKLAEVVIQPRSVEELRAAIQYAFHRRIPITLRGAGTGNYGQCIPTHGGILMDLAALDKIIEITADGLAVCEPAVRLGSIEAAARQSGWELRCYPSTYVKASVAGFCAGGSGGIGSITWGGLRENGTVHALTILTIEENPREIRLSGHDIFKVLHAWGTNGVIVRVELRLAPRTLWAQIAVSHPTFERAFDFSEALALNEGFKKRLVTCFEWPIPSWFAPLQKWVPNGQALSFFEIADDQLERLTHSVVPGGGEVVFVSPYSEVRRGPQLSDFTWNHTTLWALKADPSLTYLQCGLDPNRAREQMRQLKQRFGSDFLMHVEIVKWDGIVTPGSLPVIRYTTDERLQEMIAFCGQIGVSVANPHVNFLEGSGRWRPDDEKLVAKQQYDPNGLLNPGKMRGFAATLEQAPTETPAFAPAYGD